MEVVHLEKGLGECVLKASGALRGGGVVIYPTETLYGLGADALSNKAVDMIYAIKGRSEKKPMHGIFSSLDMVEEYAELNEAARTLAAAFLPGPLTLVLKKRREVSTGIARHVETIGVRIPDNEFCIELAKAFGRPYTATSANKAGSKAELSIEKVIAQFSDMTARINLAVDAGTLPLRQPSTVVNVVSGVPSVLREGAIPSSVIRGIFS